MAKPALGRSLRNLLGDTQIARKPEADPVPAADSAAVEVSPGLSNLLRPAKVPEAPPEEGPAKSTRVADAPVSVYKPQVAPITPPPAPAEPVVHPPRWTLISADLLLIALATMLVFKSPAPLKVWEMTVCVAAVVLGALLACAAVLGKDNK